MSAIGSETSAAQLHSHLRSLGFVSVSPNADVLTDIAILMRPINVYEVSHEAQTKHQRSGRLARLQRHGWSAQIGRCRRALEMAPKRWCRRCLPAPSAR